MVDLWEITLYRCQGLTMSYDVSCLILYTQCRTCFLTDFHLLRSSRADFVNELVIYFH
jgi:hypothetical protein